MGDVMSMSGAAYDTQNLDKLRLAAKSDPKGQIKTVAKQFEGLFVQMMLKSMRSALPQDGILDSDSTHLYTSMYDQQIAQDLSNKGLGMADMMVKQLTAGNNEPSETAGTVPMALDKEMIQSLPVQVMEQYLRKVIPTAPDRTTGGAPLGLDSGQFVSQLSGPAKAASEESGIPHQLIVAQAALESGWGQREIPTADGKHSYNLFGIKAGASWNGPTINVTTTEYVDGVAKKVQASFRVYGSYLEGMVDYVKMLTTNPRYAQVAAANTPEEAAHALQDAGYATDPAYAQKLVSVIQKIKGAGEQAVKAYTHDLSKLF
ncbi:MAG: flagellar assembly peptidoglycan hydrolase FlgJ [Rouxiella aceris]|uniref:flagellar assembly peptidoglycan hydrolase FlgJ n=1 Tax=Rouxiella aceris TaxID=2703884 RepID=UPI00284BEE2C|nr:flagellar assembly peptidoglycan hydrolase FlgJ [Rouxiella aceris]MDR3433067.1 flagellar assembly peptidoglycan hydrolase FlgJ [Rouxiella aceris]